MTKSSEVGIDLLSSSTCSSSSLAGDVIVDEDGCSICLEPFTSLDPASVTKCQHEYHLQCILEWSLRGSQCPVCLQHLVLNDPFSQEMVPEAVMISNWETKKRSNHENEYIIPRRRVSDHERLMRRRVAAAAAAASARMIMIARRRRPSTDPEQFQFISSRDSSPSVVSPADSRSRSRSRSRQNEFMAFSGSLKSKLSAAPLRYRESLLRGARRLKAKILAQNDSMKELNRGVRREMSAGIARLISRRRSAKEGSLKVDDEYSLVESLLPIERS